MKKFLFFLLAIVSFIAAMLLCSFFLVLTGLGDATGIFMYFLKWFTIAAFLAGAVFLYRYVKSLPNRNNEQRINTSDTGDN